MTSAQDVFVLQLARASHRALRFLRSRDLTREEREDVIARAMLWCWENRNNYSLTTTLETWFVNAVRNEYASWLRGEIRNSADLLSEIAGPDTTAARAQAESAAHALLAALPRKYRRVLWLEAHGYSRREMIERGVSEWDIRGARAQISQLRQLLPDPIEYRDALRTAPPPPMDGPSPDDEPSEVVEREPSKWSETLGGWVHEHIAPRVVGGLHLFSPLVTYASRIREMLNRRAGLEPAFMPTYIPPTHWRS